MSRALLLTKSLSFVAGYVFAMATGICLCLIWECASSEVPSSLARRFSADTVFHVSSIDQVSLANNLELDVVENVLSMMKDQSPSRYKDKTVSELEGIRSILQKPLAGLEEIRKKNPGSGRMYMFHNAKSIGCSYMGWCDSIYASEAGEASVVGLDQEGDHDDK